MNPKLKKQLRTIGHQLKPVVTVAGKGLSPGVLAEFDRALDRHELIKVKIVGSRETRESIAERLALITDTHIVQTIGRILLIYRPAREPDPALSNVLRVKTR